MEWRLLQALIDVLKTLGESVRPVPCGAQVVLSENDAAAALFSHFGGATRRLLSDIVGEDVTVHFDSRAAFMTTADLDDSASRSRPDIVAVVGLADGRPKPVAIAELKSVVALPDKVIDLSTQLSQVGWLGHRGQDSALHMTSSRTGRQYRLRSNTTGQLQPGGDDACLAINIFDVAAYILHLQLRWGVLTNGNRHLLVLVETKSHRIFVSRPFGLGVPSSSNFALIRPRSLLWLLGAVTVAAVRGID